MNCRYSSLALTFATLFFTGCAVEGSGSDDSAASGAAAPATPHCVQSVSSSELACFGSFTEAIAAATGQRIADAPADARAALSDPGFQARVNALAAAPRAGVLVPPPTSVVIGIEYRDDNFQGPTLTYITGAGCDGDPSTVDYVVTAIPDPWNDQISSFIAFSNCSEQLYEHANFGGSQTPIAQSLSSVGPAMNDRASSIRWF
jgi:hypothetical protein